jgi:hypothetical protein
VNHEGEITTAIAVLSAIMSLAKAGSAHPK